MFIEPSWNSHVNESLSSALVGPVFSLCDVCLFRFQQFSELLPNFYCRSEQYQAVIDHIVLRYHFSYLEGNTSMRPLCSIRGQSQTKQLLAWKGNIPVPLGLLEYYNYSGVSYS